MNRKVEKQYYVAPTTDTVIVETESPLMEPSKVPVRPKPDDAKEDFSDDLWDKDE